MLNDLKVKTGPQFYYYAPDAIDMVPRLLDEHGAKRVLVVHGGISWEKAEPYLKFLSDPRYQFEFHRYTGECSYYGADLIGDIIQDKDIDFIIGVGGGKLCDLVGFAGHRFNRQFGVIPTLASNCAPWTPLSVMYKENGESEGKSEHHMHQAAFMITDPHLVIDAPVNYFVAGLADTIAKWYESESILAQDSMQGYPFLEVAKFVTRLCNEAIIKDSRKAIEDMKNGVLSDEFINLSEIVMATAGLVGGLGDKYARNAAAHAIHDGMGKYIPASHNFLHGEKVAYGILYQMALENRYDQIDALIPFYNELHLPKSLHEMGLFPDDETVVDHLAEFMNKKEKVHLIPVEINEAVLKQAIYDLEDYMAGK